MKRSWKCRFGFHRWTPEKRLITISTARCERCGAELISSLFGGFIEYPEGSASPNPLISGDSPNG